MKMRISFKEKIISEEFLKININQIVLGLKDRGFGSGDLVVFKANSHFGTLIQWLSCIEVGVIPVFIPFGYSIDSIRAWSHGLNVKIIVETIGARQHTFLNMNDTKSVRNRCRLPLGSIVHLTSATTGNPKLVLRTKEQISAEIDRYCQYLKLSCHDVILPIVPLYHSFGFVSAMMVSLRLGATLVIPDLILPRNIIQLCNSNKVTVLLGVPYFFRKMLTVSDSYTLYDGIRYVISSGGPMEENLQKLFQDKFKHFLLQQYGSTETGSLSISCPGDNYQNVGVPLPGVQFNVSNGDSKKPWVYVSSPTTIGYYITKNGIIKLDGEHYEMGDIGQYAEDDKLVIYGRGDHVLLIAGKKFDKKTVSAVILKMTQVKAVDVFIKKRNGIDEVVCEYCSNETIKPKIFIEHCRKFLPDYQIPKNYFKVSQINDSIHYSWKIG